MKISTLRAFFLIVSMLFVQTWETYAAFISPETATGTIRIIENKGQWEPQVLFKASIPGGNLFITKQGFAYALFDEKTFHEATHDREKVDFVKAHNIKVDFLQSNPTPTVVTEQQSTEYYNYYLGNDPSRWTHHCYAYEKITLKEVYPNIDLEIIALQKSFKMNFVVHPGGDPSLIQLKYNGADALNLYDGALNIATSVGVIKEEKPISFQGNATVRSGFVVTGNVLSYKLSSSYNKQADLVIDPTVVFGTFSGSFADNWGFTATFDKDGNAYGGGTVYSFGYPVTTGAYQIAFNGGVTDFNSFEDIARDAGILKFSADGTQLLFATYLGGSHNEQPHSMICDNSDNLIVMGTTRSLDFPVTSTASDNSQNGGYDIFVSKFNTDGTAMLGSTYIGGSENDGINNDFIYNTYDKNSNPLTYNYGDDFRGEVNIDASNNIYVSSTTRSSIDFPITNALQPSYGGGTQDACLFKLNSSLSSLSFSTYLGGNGSDAAYGIAFDNIDNIFVCGGTSSSNITSTGGTTFAYHGKTDGFIAKISSSGNSLLAFVHVGTSEYDQAYFIQSDKQNNIYISGQTMGSFPVSSGVFSNTGGKQFIAILDRNLTTINRSTVFGTGGSTPDISLSAFLVDVCGRVFVSGWGGTVNKMHNPDAGTTSRLPVTKDAVQKATDGSDFYLIVLSKNLVNLAYATYYGGGTSSEHVDGGTSRFDKSGTVYQSVCGGCGGNSSFPTTPGAYSRTNNSNNCNNAIFKITLDVSQYPPTFKDTLVKVYAGDLLKLPFKMTDPDEDSIFFTGSGSVLNFPGNPATITSSFNKGTSTGLLTWNPLCKDVSKDTLTINLNMIDNGCPTPKSSIGKIKILVLPAPLAPAPFPQCLKTVDPNTVKLDWLPPSDTKYLKGYKIYRQTNSGAPQLISTTFNLATTTYTDPLATSHAINNYCYFISTINICDSIGDSSRLICSLYKSDTSIAPVFKWTKDTTLYVYAFDTLSYTTIISTIDPKDSVYMQCEGSMIGNPNLITMNQTNKGSSVSLGIRWVAKCEGLTAADTPYIHFHVKDNQCPSPRSVDGMIRIIIVKPPANPPPVLPCIKFVTDDKVEVRWPETTVNKYFDKFILLKRGPDGTIAPVIKVKHSLYYDTTDAAPNNLVNNYCYAVTSQDVCGYYGDTSDFQCTQRKASDYPFTVPFYTVTVQDNKNVAVFWRRSKQTNFTNYILYKKDLKTSDYSKLYEGNLLTDTFYIDQQVKVQEKSYCYKISQVNDCGLESNASTDACSILLKGISNPFEHNLKWNGFHYWPTEVRTYNVIRKQPDIDITEMIAQNSFQDTLSFDNRLNYENGLYHYVIVANENTKGTPNISMSNEIELIQAPLLHVPNVFTPNEDGLNDTWNVVPVFVKDFHLKIFDRWGRLIFETKDKHNQFDGIVQGGGDPATNDVFVYVVTYTGWDGSSYIKKGNLTILR